MRGALSTSTEKDFGGCSAIAFRKSVVKAPKLTSSSALKKIVSG